MSWFEALILGLIQGLTEFLPVSSSGHLLIGQSLLGLDTSGADDLLFTIIVHAATVLSTIVVLYKEIWSLLKGGFSNLKWNGEKEYILKICISMIPIFVVGIFFKDKVEAIFGSGLVLVGICLIITSLLLGFAYFAKPRVKENISYWNSFVIGLAQAVAVLPGLSRSGSTIATGLLLGNKKESIAQFSFLMVLIPILGEAFLSVLDIIKEPELISNSIGVLPLVIGFVAAFAAGWAACKFMINIVKRGKLIYFAAYCLIVGATTLIFALI